MYEGHLQKDNRKFQTKIYIIGTISYFRKGNLLMFLLLNARCDTEDKAWAYLLNKEKNRDKDGNANA